MDKAERAAQLTQEVFDGLEAKSLVESKAWRSTVSELESSYINAIRSGNWFKKRAREENCRRLQILDDLVAIIENKIISGEEARKRLEANNGNK